MSSKQKSRIDGKVFKELAVKNVKKSARDYLIYFFTITFGVCLFYSFNSIDTQFAMLQMDDRLNFLAFTSTMMAGISVVVCAIIGFLIVYANRYLLRRRKREIGIYVTLGMDQKDMAALLMRETLLIGIVSLIAGIIAGIFVSQGLSMITAKIIGASLENFHFMISLKAVISSAVFFAVIFFFVHKFNVREIKKLKLIDLLHDEKKNEVVKGSGLKDLLLLPGSLALMGCGYGVIFGNLDGFPGMDFVIGILLMAAGTFVFFSSAINAVLKLLEKNKAIYYKGLNMFAIRQLASKIKSNSVSISVITLLLFFSITFMAYGLGGGRSITQNRSTPFDASLEERADADGVLSDKDLVSQIDLSQFAKEYSQYTVYSSRNIRERDFLLTGMPDYDEAKTNVDGSRLSIMGVDEYNHLMQLQGQEQIHLGEKEFALSYDVSDMAKIYKYYEKHAQEGITLNGQKLTLAQDGVQKGSYQIEVGPMNAGTVIVSQQLVSGLSPEQRGLAIVFKDSDKETYEKYLKAVSNLPLDIRESNKNDVTVQTASDHMNLSFLGIYVGIAFLMTAGAVLALQQLSQAADNEKRYGLLSKLGTKKSHMKSAVRGQLLIYFGLPLVLGGIHAAVILTALFGQMSASFSGIILQSILFAAGLVTVVYGIYFATTYTASKRMAGLSD